MATRNGVECFCETLKLLDEVQYSVSKDMVEIFQFDDKDSAKNFTHEKMLSAIGHGKKYYRAVSPMSEIIKNNIDNTVRDLKLKVDLGFEFCIGKNWAQCH